jgi:hypothetical protein
VGSRPVVELARRLRAIGIDLIDCSSGGAVRQARSPSAQATGAVRRAHPPRNRHGDRRRRHDYHRAQADEIIRGGRADVVLLARQMLRDPYFAMHAAQELGVPASWPIQYARAAPAGRRRGRRVSHHVVLMGRRCHRCRGFGQNVLNLLNRTVAPLAPAAPPEPRSAGILRSWINFPSSVRMRRRGEVYVRTRRSRHPGAGLRGLLQPVAGERLVGGRRTVTWTFAVATARSDALPIRACYC